MDFLYFSFFSYSIVLEDCYIALEKDDKIDEMLQNDANIGRYEEIIYSDEEFESLESGW